MNSKPKNFIRRLLQKSTRHELIQLFPLLVAGIHKEIRGRKLIVIPDCNWKSFAEEIIKNARNTDITPTSYYQYHYWESIVRKIL